MDELERFLTVCFPATGIFYRTVVIPRTSEQEHKLFLYLSEVARQEPSRKLPEALLFNLFAYAVC